MFILVIIDSGRLWFAYSLLLLSKALCRVLHVNRQPAGWQVANSLVSHHSFAQKCIMHCYVSGEVSR